MTTSLKSFAIRTLALSALGATAMSSANAGVFFYRTAVVVRPVIAAPVVVAPVYVPTCRFVAIPVVNAFTGFTYMVTRQVCN
jgi:hypothetical protein